MNSSARLLGSIVLLAGALMVAGHGQAQESQVTVRAESEGIPLSDAQVVSGTLGALTNEEGVAVLRLPAGDHTVTVRKIGYSTFETALSLAAGADTTLSVDLEEEAVEVQGIVVSSTRSDRRIEDEPLRVEAITREEIEEKLQMTPGDISMLLNETAGLRVQPTAPSLGGASVRIQGLRGRYTQILSDGLPLNGGQSGALGPLQIPPMDLAQVEVIKGAASALYGSTALGGVVNLISRRPEDERELLVNQTTLGGTDAVLWLSNEVNEAWGYTLLGGLHRQRKADVDDDGWADVPGFRRALLRPRVSWEDGRGRSVFVTVGGMIEDREGGTLSGRTTPSGTAFPEELETRRIDGGLVGRMLFSGGRLLTVRGSTMAQRHDHLFGDASERDVHRTTFVEAALSGATGAHAWVLGSAFQYEAYEGRDVPEFDFRYSTPALFVQDEYAPADWLTLSGSARLDRHSEFGTFVNPRFSLLFRPAEWVVRASVGTGYFAPSPFTEETEAVGLRRLEPYEDLEPERARNAMLDVSRSIGSWELNGTLFGSEIDDALAVSLADGGRVALSNSPDPVRTWGTELLARYTEEPWHLSATHVYMRSRELDVGGAQRSEVPLTPRHAVGVVGAWEAEGRGRVGAEFYYTGRQELADNPYRTESKPHVMVGLLVEWRFGRARLFINAENIFDTRQTAYDRLVLPSRSPEGRWITDVWAPLEGRVINGGVRLTL